MNLFKQVKNKIKERAAESLTEVLIAVLISSMAIALLAGTTERSSHMIKSNASSITTYYGQNNALETQNSGGVTATVTMVQKDDQTKTVYLGKGKASVGIKYFKNATDATTPVIAYVYKP